MKKQEKTKQPVVVTTEYRGVFFGYLEGEPAADSVVLSQARNCLYWSADVRGFMGLANTGPSKDCRVGPAVPKIELRKITAIIEATPEAVEKWEKSPWS